uniref:Uncharacterized protein n=1 Tax=Sphaerodactylus townsendi TaxID=933632 RepID=A0ACB8FWK7_9SAUR
MTPFDEDNKKPFVDPHPKHPEVIYVHNGTEVIVVPCRVTSPDIIPDLRLHSPTPVVFSQKQRDWDPKRGFLVTSPSFEFFSGMLKCVTVVDGVTYTSSYLPQKVEERIRNLVLKATPQKLLVGETLHLMCTAETFFNGRIVFDWKFPKGKVHKPVKALGPKKEQKYEAKAGQKMLRLAWKVDAFPRPNVTWYKDGKLIAENSSCYELDPLKYRLVIRDLRAKHDGNYTISLSNTKHGLYENLTSHLVVLGEHLI